MAIWTSGTWFSQALAILGYVSFRYAHLFGEFLSTSSMLTKWGSVSRNHDEWIQSTPNHSTYLPCSSWGNGSIQMVVYIYFCGLCDTVSYFYFFFHYVIIVSPFLVVFIPPPVAEPRWLWHSPFRCLHFPRHLGCYPVYNTCYLQPILLDGAQLEVGSRYLICYPVYFDISTNPRY